MLLQIPEILSPEQIRECRTLLDAGDWADGGHTAGFQSMQVKNNLQLPPESQAALSVRGIILDALDKSLLFQSAALPARIFPPLFNCYREGHGFGNHVDNAVRPVPGSRQRVRTDVSATLFFSEPDEYDGGELIIDDTYGAHSAKLPAGSMVLYPGTSLHRVNPVGRGRRIASFFWVQSLVREDAQRALLFDMDMAILRLRSSVGDSDDVLSLTNVYHNLLRRWSTV